MTLVAVAPTVAGGSALLEAWPRVRSGVMWSWGPRCSATLAT
jgi:hypothetical protein